MAARDSSRSLGSRAYRRPIRVELLEDRRLLTAITVDTPYDTTDIDDGLTSLREAIFAANIVSGPNLIEFAESITADGPATILLTKGELAITDALTILGPGSGLLTIDASGSDTDIATFGNGARIFRIDDHTGTAVDVLLGGLTLTGGDPNDNGGAILSRELLSVDGIAFVANHSRSGGGAISHAGPNATIANSTFLNNGVLGLGIGGAVFIEGFSSGQTVSIVGNQMHGNSAAQGGALAARGGSASATLIVDNNTIVQNNSAGSGGGISIDSSLLLQATIRNSTISGNKSPRGGGIFAAQTRELAIFNTDVTNNISPTGTRGGGGGGAYFQNSDVSITASTITGNESSTGGGIYSRQGDLAIRDSEIANNKALNGRGGGVVGYSSRFSLVGSTISGNSAKSTANGGGGLWLVPAQGSMPVLADSLIKGNSSDGNGGGIEVRTGTEGVGAPSLMFNNVIIANNTAGAAGGGIYATSTASGTTGPGLFFTGGAIAGNSAAVSTGGGIHSTFAVLSIQGTTISDNRARGSGGGIAIPANIGTPVQVTIVDAALDGNIASYSTEGPAIGDGGALWVASANSTVNITSSSFTHNSARSGGAIFRRPTGISNPFSIVGSTISGNTAMLSGGGVYNERGPLLIERSVIEGNRGLTLNSQPGLGGGVLNRMTDLAINASSISGNATDGRGGGIYHVQGDLTINNTTIAGNSSKVDGGGVYGLANSPSDRILVYQSTVSGNSSPRTGGLYLRGDSTIRHSTIVGNRGGRTTSGGVVAGDGSSRFELDHSIVAKNTVDSSDVPTPDIRFFLTVRNVSLRYSLIGDSTGTSLAEAPLGSSDVNGNLIGKSVASGGHGAIDPMVGMLVNNGGPTKTHSLLPGSPALDGGSLVTGTPRGYDQRGNPYRRMVDGTGDGVLRIDIGAYESQGIPNFTSGDFNRDGFVDACDYLLWRNNLGAKSTPFVGADADGNGFIGQGDFEIWKAHFGQGLAFTTGGGSAALALAAEMAEPVTGSSLPLAPRPPALPTVLRSNASPRAARSLRLSSAAHDQLLARWHAHYRADKEHQPRKIADGEKSIAADEVAAEIPALDRAFAALAL